MLDNLMGIEKQNKNIKATLRDVARVAGVSSTTVSRVLNDKPNVSDAIKDKVQSAIENLGYSPSPTARALNTGRTYTVGALVPTLDNAIFARFLDALEKRLTFHNLNLVISTTDEDPKTEVQNAIDLLNMGAEALIVSGEIRHPDFDQLISRNRIPVIITSYFTSNSPYPSIGYNNAQISKIALNHLFDRGHNSIAVIHGPTKHNDRTRERLKGIQEDKRFSSITYHEADISIGSGCAAARLIIRQKGRPSAIFCLSDVLALGVMFELSRKSISIPDEIAIMGFDNLSWSAHTNPPLSTIELSVASMGIKVADELNQRLNKNKPIQSQALEGQLIIRHST